MAQAASCQRCLPGSGFAGPQDRARDRGEGQYLFGGSQCDGLPGHSEDDAGGFVLGDRASASPAHREKPLRPVGSHTGQQHAYGFTTGGFRHRQEKNVNRGSLVADPGTGFDLHEVLSLALSEQHVEVSRGDQGEAGAEGVPILRFFHIEGADLIQSIGKGAREFGWNMLSDDDSRSRRGQFFQDGGNGLGATGGSPDGDDRSRR